MIPIVNEAIVWLAKDLRKNKPALTHTIFTASELNEKAGLSLSKMHESILLSYLEKTSFVVKTNKIGPTGPYFNIHRNPFIALHKGDGDSKFVSKLENPEIGFCLTKTKKKTYRMVCAGRKCKFFLASEKQCIQGKFFMK